MFTIEQITATHAKVKSGVDFPQYVQDLKVMGISHYDVMVEDSRAIYYGINGEIVTGKGKYPVQAIATIGSAEQLQQALIIHQQGQTDYLTFCRQAATAGVEKWTTHILHMKVIYYDKQGNNLLTETIPLP